MAYSELIKNFNRIREYMREFYVYGFKSREEYTKKSSRSYDDERRRLDSWLSDYMQFRQTPEGKNVFLSIDSRISRHNPLFKAWKTKSFTDGDITLHFILLDLFHDSDMVLTLKEIMQKIDGYLAKFKEPKMFDESTVRKKLTEYVREGILLSEKNGKTMVYRRNGEEPVYNRDAVDYFSEVLPCGVIGTYLNDTEDMPFSFKHHYITGALDSEIVYGLLTAISEKRYITLETINRKKDRVRETQVVPLRIMFSAQSGRQYLMAFTPRFDKITSYRTDNIVSVKLLDTCAEFEERKGQLADLLTHVWGVSTQGRSDEALEHIEFTVHYSDFETHVPQRLEREKRCGKVEHLDSNTSRFTADVTDSWEVIPWIRTFLCRITDISFSNQEVEKQFRDDLKEMYEMYGLERGE